MNETETRAKLAEIAANIAEADQLLTLSLAQHETDTHWRPGLYDYALRQRDDSLQRIREYLETRR